MSTEIKIWQVLDGHISPVEETSFATSHLESELEQWIVESPEILGEDVLIISRQKTIEGVGRLDLLAINESGQLVIIELKRTLTPREAVAQALDYAAWIEQTNEKEILGTAADYLNKELSDAFTEHFQIELPTVTPQNHKIMLVGSGLDSAAERIINYLAQRYSVNINAIFFRYAQIGKGQEILVRSVLVPESVLPPTRQGRPKTTISELLSLASERQVLPFVEAFRGLGQDQEYVEETASSTYGGSFRHWRKALDGKSKMVFGVNISGQRCDTPTGQLDVWITPKTISAVIGLPETEIRETLQKQFEVLDPEGFDYVIRLKSAVEAQKLADQLKAWFDEHPGFYKAAS